MFFVNLILRIKVFLFKNIISDNKPKFGKKVKIKQPTLFLGGGKIILGDNVRLGYFPSAGFFSTYNHIETKSNDISISIGEYTVINNNCNIVAFGEDIEIGKNCRIGLNFKCFSSDFHGLQIEDRDNPDKVKNAPVKIGDNVFIGNDVTVLKGVTIADGSIVGACSVVTKDVPENTIVCGNPAKIISKLS